MGGGEWSGVSVYEMRFEEICLDAFASTSKGFLGSEVSFLVATEIRESKLKDVGRTAIFVFEAMERLRSDITRHAYNGCVRSHGQWVFEGKTT